MDVDALLAWYDRVRRALPWRETRDPYALLVSEVMLQQTQAARVVPYYEAFLARFPDPATLAAAPPRDVLAVWSGLGYNRRALALRAAARTIAEHGWPDDLTELPGVGPYTAAAVGSFAWDRHHAAIDTNARRVIERFDGVARPPRDVAERATALIPAGRAAAFNQAMMELGATVCRARGPGCDACPIGAGCATRAVKTAERGGPRDRSARRFEDTDRGSTGRAATRFEDTDRWARGRVVAALLAGDEPPAAIAPSTGFAGGARRRERVLAGLERDGLVVRGPDGSLRLPE
jgi:A/G-specific adenine glycosylase